MKPDHPARRIRPAMLLVLLGISPLPVIGVAGEDWQAEQESRRLESEARRLQEQGQREMEERARIQADALRSQEESILRMQALQQRMEMDAERRAWEAEDQLRSYRHPEIRSLPGPASRIDAVSGMNLAPLSDRLKSYFGTTSGVLVISAGGRAPFDLQDGDVILSIDGRVPADAAHAQGILRSYRTGERVKLRVQRDRRPMELDVTAP